MPLVLKALLIKLGIRIGYTLLRPYLEKLVDDPKSNVDDEIMNELDLAITGKINVKPSKIRKPD